MRMEIKNEWGKKRTSPGKYCRPRTKIFRLFCGTASNDRNAAHKTKQKKKKKKIAYNSEDCHVMSVSVSHDDGEKRREEKRREEKGKEKNE